MGRLRIILIILAASKILARMITDRLQPIMDFIIPETQAGFRLQRGVTDMILIWMDTSLFSVFVDLKKTSNMIHRDALWRSLDNFGGPKNLVSTTRDLRKENKPCHIAGRDVSEDFFI